MKKQLVIRLQRAGRISKPFFHIVVTRKEKSAGGAFIAKIGSYDPFMTKTKGGFLNVVIYRNVLNYWIAKGAKPNDTVQKLLFSL